MIANAPGQVEHLRDEQLPPPKHEPDADTKPRMPFKTSLLLTREQEDAMVKHAIDRTKQLEDQLGRKFREGGSGKIHGLHATIDNPDSFMGKRERYTLRYYNHVADRAGKVVESVYDHSNLTASLSQRITMQMIASAIGFFFGQPDDIDWFSSNAVGAEDENASDKIKKHSRWKIDQCGVKTQLYRGAGICVYPRGSGRESDAPGAGADFQADGGNLRSGSEGRRRNSGCERGLHLPREIRSSIRCRTRCGAGACRQAESSARSRRSSRGRNLDRRMEQRGCTNVGDSGAAAKSRSCQQTRTTRNGGAATATWWRPVRRS
jgi:hypothetical protein